MTDLAPRTRAESDIDDAVPAAVGVGHHRLDTRPVGGAWVFSAVGLVDDSLARSLDRTVRAVGPQVAILDLSDAVVVSRRPLARALRAMSRAAAPDESPAVSLVCPRLSAVALMRKWGLLGAVSLHLTLDEALEEDEPEEVTPT